MQIRRYAWLVALACGLSPVVAAAQEARSAEVLLHVVRLKPGEAKRVELALPYGVVGFKPSGASGRDLMSVEVLPAAKGALTAKGTPVKRAKRGLYRLAPGVELVWVADRPEIEFRAGKDAKAGAIDVRVRYESFGGGEFVGGFRVIVEAP
jgi:hypothetical protein